MEIKKASKSAFECFDNCSWQYYLQYIIGLRTPSGKSALLGTICHNVLELLAKFKKSKRIHNRTILNNPDILLDICFARHSRMTPEIPLVNADKNECRKWLSKILDGPRDPRKLDVIYVEHGFLMEFHKPGFKYQFKDIIGQFCLNGYIDLINIIEENGEKVLEIVDYKFGKYSTDWATGEEKTNDNIRKDLQMRCYYLACQYLFPEFQKIKLTVVYVQLGKVLSCYMDESDATIAIDDIRRRFKNIINTKQPIRLIDDKSKSKQHFKCRSVCHFGKTKDSKNGKSLCENYYRQYVTDASVLYELTMNRERIKTGKKPIQDKIIIK